MRDKMWRFYPIVLLCFGCSAVFGSNNGNFFWSNAKKSHQPLPLTQSKLRFVADLSDEDHFVRVLQPFNRTRVIGTEGHSIVRKHIVDHLRDLTWTVEENTFDDQIPNGDIKRFTNIIATYNPYATRRLVLACHYESRIVPQGFIGAIDSAVPCAMLLNLATVMRDVLLPLKKRHDLTLQLIFFDGEEAFVNWNKEDSLYGARHLARAMGNTLFPPGGSFQTTELDRIDLFVLLDLLGTEDCQFVNLFRDTERWYNRLVALEKAFKKSKLIGGRRSFMFQDANYYHGRIEDDHVPFLERGVPILHLISAPFPKVWHKISDDFNALHYPTIRNFNTLLRGFVTEYLHVL